MSTLQIADGFRVDPADFERDLAAIRAVREPVFLVEQQVPPELEWDELDPLSRHVLARDFEGRPIGTGRLTPEHRIGRMAVLADWRGKGVGEAMLFRLLDAARDLGYPSIELHAQTHAIPFYARAGFAAEGDEFLEAGIPHRVMRMALEPRAAVEHRQLPEQNEQAVESLEQCRSACLEVLRQARHRLWIYTRNLDPELLCNEPALAELRRIAVSGRGADIRMLVQEPGAGLRPAAQLVDLAQRASTTIAIRAPVDEVDLNYPSAYLLNDAGGYLFRPIGSRFEGSTHLHAPGRNRQLHETFSKVWERSEAPVELRALKL
jgi:predicted GNAT family N-acyltransferase